MTDIRSSTPVEKEKVGRDGWLVLCVFGSFLSLFIAVVAVAFGVRAIDEADDGTVAAGGEPQSFDIELGDLYVKPKSIDVQAGTEVVVNVTNKGAMAHDLRLEGKTGTDMPAWKAVLERQQLADLAEYLWRTYYAPADTVKAAAKAN